jgi:curli biogenesis system outer membrane secretion channel CsgG
MRTLKILLAAATAMSLSACVSTAHPTAQFKPATGFSPTLNRSPMDPAINCMSQATGVAGRAPLRLGVGQIKDYTGKFSNEASEGGFKVTQGGSLMVMSALGKMAGIDQVERFDTAIAEQEAALSKAQLVRDPTQSQGQVVRPLTAGMYDGSDYYIVGGITEANFTISSGGLEMNVAQIGGGSRYYVMNVAADLRLVDTRSLKVVKTISVQKQIVGREVRAGVFNFLGDYLVDINSGNKSNEPIQMGVRATLELGTLELLSPLYDNYFAACRPLADAAFGGKLNEPKVEVAVAKATQDVKVKTAAMAQAKAQQRAQIQAQAQAQREEPVRMPAQADIPAPAPAPAASVQQTAYSAQIGASRSRQDVDRMWKQLSSAHPDAFAGKATQVETVAQGDVQLFRAVVVGFNSRAEASAFCRDLQAGVDACFVRR